MWLWALLPVCLALFGTAGIWSVFAISITNGSVNLTEGVPYISRCGTYSPQSCLFSQICNICALLVMWVVVIRFQQVRDFGHHGKANTASIVLGFISCFGISLLGNFQQSVLLSVHLLGALLAFLFGLVYFWVQLYLTYKAQPSRDRCIVGPLRAICCILCTISVILMVVLHNIGYRSEAAICEWILVMLFFCLFGLFAAEFRHIDCHRLTVQKKALLDPRQDMTEMNGYITDALR